MDGDDTHAEDAWQRLWQMLWGCCDKPRPGVRDAGTFGDSRMVVFCENCGALH